MDGTPCGAAKKRLCRAGLRALSAVVCAAVCAGLFGCAERGTLGDSVPLTGAGSGQTQQTAGQDGAVNELSRRYYDRLGRRGQTLYREMYALAASYASGGPLTPAPKEEIDDAFLALCSDHPELFWLSSYGGSYSSLGGKVVEVVFEPGYSYTRDERDRYAALLGAERDRLLQKAGDGDDYSRALAIYTGLLADVRYAGGEECGQSMVSSLAEGRAVCAGYARALQYLLNSAGIACTYVSGTAGGEPHAWNLAQLDGEWYYMDPTWGDTDTGLPTGQPLVHCEYFTMTSEQLLADHTPAGAGWPDCTATADLYFTREGTALPGWQPDAVQALLAEALAAGRPGVCLSLPDEAAYAEACAAVERGDISAMLSRIDAAGVLDAAGVSYYRNDARRVLNLLLPYRG